ncbi:MAG: DinB family protein [Phycisphaeraceae bacterium]|nr:DinB family protein [Phycisphaeraceae bacterium]
MDALKVYDYLTTSRERVFDAIRPLTPEQYARVFSFGLKSIAATLTHIMISEWYYVERVAGRTVAPYSQWPIKYEHAPAFEVVERTWREQARNTRATVAAERDWARSITWLSFPDDKGRRFNITATSGDFFAQLAFHEVHHRAQVMVMLRELGRPLEDLDYNALMFQRQPAV